MSNRIMPLGAFKALVLILSMTLSATDAKPHKLSFLALSPSKDTLDGRSCTASMQIAVDAVNSRQDTLGDYEISVTYKEEGLSAALIPTSFVQFIETAQANGTNMAPVLVGPFSFCEKVSYLARYHNMVQFTYGCISAAFTARRKEFPNLYRSTIPVEDSSISAVYFAKYTAQWKEAAMLAYAGNSNEFPSVKKTLQSAQKEGIKFLYFTSELDVDTSIAMAFKESGARAIVLGTTATQFIAKFLCLAFDQGMTGPRYAFIVPSFAFFSPDVVPFMKIPGCTREKMLEQFKQTFWDGTFFSAVEYTGNSSLGYDMLTFDKRLNTLLGNARPVDYAFRHICHDVMSQALLVLDKADGLLKHTYNKTLLDYGDDPELVMNVVNSTAAKMEFRGLRAGRMSYSERLEMDSEPAWVAQAVNGIPKMILKVQTNTFPTDLLHVNVTYINQPLWFTENREPPKDLSNIRHFHYAYPETASYVAIILSAVFAFVKLLLLLVCLVKRDTADSVRNGLSNVLILFAGILLDCSAAMTAAFYQNENSMVTFCYVKIFFTTLGVAGTLSCLFMRILLLEISSRIEIRARSVRARSTVHTAETRFSSRVGARGLPADRMGLSTREAKPSVAVWRQQREVLTTLKWNHGTFVLLGTSILTVVNIMVPVIYLLVNNNGLFISAMETTPITFSTEIDSYFDFATKYCSSERDSLWMCILAAFNAALMVIALCFCYKLRLVAPVQGLRAEYISVRVATVNAAGIYMCVIALLMIIGLTRTTLQMSIFIYGLLAFSLSTCCIAAYPCVLPFWSRKVQRQRHLEL